MRRAPFRKVGRGRKGVCIGTYYIKFTDGQDSKHYRLKEYDNGCDIRQEYKQINRETYNGAVKAGKKHQVIDINEEMVPWHIRKEFESQVTAG